MSFEFARGKTEFKYGMGNPDQLLSWLEENPGIIGLGFVGRSNVGKSSLINTLFGRGTARVSNTPGRTREINIFTFQVLQDGKVREDIAPLYLFDLPGHGHAKVNKEMSEKWEKLMGNFFTTASEHISIINLQDARHPHQKSDQDFSNYLQNFNFESFLVFNKIDKLKKQKERAALEKMKPQLFDQYQWIKQIHFVSAESKKGIPQLENSIITHLLTKIEAN